MKGLTYITAAPIIFTPLNLVQCGVREVEFLSAVIYGQAVGSFNVTADDHEHVGTIQRGSHDAGSLLVPVGPKHETVMGTNTKTSIMMCSGSAQNVLVLMLWLTELK